MPTAKKLFDVVGTAVVRAITSDRKELALRTRQADRNAGCLPQLISRLGGDQVFVAGTTRVRGWSCPSCGNETVTETGAPVIRAWPANYPQRPAQFECTLCETHLGTVVQIAERLVPEWRAQLELFRKIRGTAPIEQRWTVARYGDSTLRYHRFTATAIKACLPSQHSCSAHLVKVLAFNESQVEDMMQDPKLLELMNEVELDKAGRPLQQWCADVGWSPEDSTDLHEAVTARRRAAEREVDHELAQLRVQRLRAAGV